ncbi:MAG: sortase [Anaerolineales bacterium]
MPDNILPGGTSTLKITITNPTSSTIEGVSFSDTFPTDPDQMVVAADPAASTVGCGSPTFSPLADDTSIHFTDGSLGPSSSCIVKVNVTVPTAGSYVNTTGFLFINTTINTGNTATDTLTAAEAAVCTPGVRMAYWPIPNGTTANPPDLPGGAPTEKSDRVSTAAVAANDPARTLIDASGGSNDDTKWVTWGYKTPLQWIDFVIDTSHFRDVVMTFHEMVDANGPLTLVVSCDTGPACSSVLTIDPHPRDSVFRLRTADFTGLTNTGGNTTFRISGTGANNDQSGANLHLDDIEFIGCMETDPPPILDKSFAPDTIPQNTVSTLTFSLSNTDPSAVDLTGVAFSDALPPGLEVADIPNASTTCLGPVVWNPLDGDTTLNFSGATMAADSSCTAQVDIKATSAGVFDNVSGYISSNESGENTTSDGFGTDTLTAIAPASISKVFADALILTDATTTLTFTITNPNQSQALTGIGFDDMLPAGLTVETDSASPCGGTQTTTAPNSIVFAGGSLAATSSCTFDVTVTGETTGTKVNTTTNVTSTEGGPGNSASDTLTVRDPIASISLIKLVATSDTGPWKTFVAVAAGAEVHYQFVVENTGEVPLSPISITDDMLDVSACNTAWSSITLPVAVAANDDHITTCTLGPFAAVEGSHENFALATGTYDSTDVYSYPPSKATYATTGITLVKSVAQIRFSGSGETLNYTYLVTNSGYAQLEGPVTIDDDKATDESCPEVTTVGDGDAYLERGESITCTASYLTQAADVDAGLVTNTATATVDGVTSLEDSETVPYEAPVDLGITKDDGVTMYLPGGSLTYTVVVSNAGPNDAVDATFVDNRPADISSWFWSCVATGTASCGAVDSGAGDISVSDIDLPSGAGNFLTYTIDATVSGSATDPITNSASVTAPDGTYDANTDDNSASDTDTLTPPVNLGVTKTDGVTMYLPGGSLTYTIVVSNAGPNDAVDATFADSRPAGISSWSWSCVASGTASCGAVDSGTGDISVSDVDLPSGAGNFLSYAIDATVSGSATDAITNTATVSAPDGTFDTDTGDNAASDTDTLTPPVDLEVTKDDGVTEYYQGGSLTYTIVVSNAGPSDAVDATFVDNRPADISSWSWSCVASGTASCGAVDSGAGDISVSDIDLPSGAGNFLTYTIDATVSGSATDPITNTAAVTAPTGTYDTDTESNSASDTDTMAPEPSMALTKTGTLDNTVVDPDTKSNVNDTITYAFQVENTGNIPLNNIVVTDPILPTLDCSIPSLAVGAQTNCLASNNVYLLTQADIDNGVVNNTASAESEETGPANDSESVPVTQVPALSIEKEVSQDGNAWLEKVWVEVGDTVYFRLRIANEGNVTLTGLAVEDGMASCTLVRDADLSGNDDDDFEVGEEWQYTCSISAVQGSYTNIATANSNETEEVTDDATYVGGSIFDPPSGIKTVDEEGASILEWTMVWINDSNDTVLGARVSDPIPEFSTYVALGAPSGYPVPGGAPAGSTNVGVACTDTSDSTETTLCYYEGPTGPYPRGRIVWEGSIGPDPGAADADEADHELTITFSILLDDGITTIQNVATLDADLNGDGDYGDTGESKAATVDETWERELPPTGFAPGRVTALHGGAQPFALHGGLELDVPALGIRLPIVGVSADGGSWGVNWLNGQAGWLQGTAFPSWPGNSVLTGHSYLASGLPGPFVDLKELRWGDEIILHVFGYRHVYRVQRRLFVLPDDLSVISHEDDPWLTLITCYGFDEARNAYRYRVVVQAVWVGAEIEY